MIVLGVLDVLEGARVVVLVVVLVVAQDHLLEIAVVVTRLAPLAVQMNVQRHALGVANKNAKAFVRTIAVRRVKRRAIIHAQQLAEVHAAMDVRMVAGGIV